MRELLQETLEISGYKVTASEDGEDCLGKFDASPEKFDCVILDMMMPKLDGEETLAAIRKRGSKVPVIITSGFTRQSTIAELNSAGVKFLQKPYKLKDLMKLVQATLKPLSQKV
jgi:DNA-binding response OmpR family regulator